MRLARRGAGFESVQFLTRFEANGFAWRNVHFSAGAGIAADAGFAGADAEDAESAKFDALACCQSLLEAFEDRVHRRFSLGARQARALDHVMNNILLDQWSNLRRDKLVEAYLTTYTAHTTDFVAIRKGSRKAAGHGDSNGPEDGTNCEAVQHGVTGFLFRSPCCALRWGFEFEPTS